MSTIVLNLFYMFSDVKMLAGFSFSLDVNTFCRLRCVIFLPRDAYTECRLCC